VAFWRYRLPSRPDPKRRICAAEQRSGQWLPAPWAASRSPNISRSDRGLAVRRIAEDLDADADALDQALVIFHANDTRAGQAIAGPMMDGVEVLEMSGRAGRLVWICCHRVAP
jgi:hypothetical protein